jgi:SP family arabinose:H+ symporter-like MFS transporter
VKKNVLSKTGHYSRPLRRRGKANSRERKRSSPLSKNSIIGPPQSNAIVQDQGSPFYLYGAVLVACTGGFIYGFASFVITGVILFLTKGFSLSPSEVGFAISSMIIGCLIGSSVAGTISDRLGRKKAMAIAGLLWLASAIGSALARDITDLYLFRICGGLGVAIAMLVAPIYIAEISPAHLRGRLATANQFIINGGALAALFVCYGFSFSQSWRWPFAVGIVPAVLLLVGLLFTPESPRWLVETQRQDKALAILTKINGAGEAHASLREIIASQSGEQRSSSGLFRSRIRIPLIVGIGIAAFQQLTGASAVAFYAPVIFQRAGISNTSTAIGLSACLFISNMICVVIAFGLVDRWGRKPLLLAGCVGTGLGLITLTCTLNFGWSPYLAVAATVFIQAVCNCSWGPLGWVILGEIFPTNVRARAMSIATLCLWVSMFASVQFVPSLFRYFEKAYGSGAPTFLIFVVPCVCAYLFVWRMLPETKGRTLEEIATFWGAPETQHRE